MENTLSFSEKVKGWTSFHSFEPDWMARLNKRFFSIKEGQLYMHNDETNPIRNNFYGVQYSSKITTEFNDAASDDKIFKNFVIQGDRPWKATIETNLANGVIEAAEFNNKESRWFAYTRKNEDATDLHSGVAQGIGVIASIVGLNITFNSLTDNINVDDKLYQLNAGAEELIGTVVNIIGNALVVNAITTTPVVGYFAFAKKNARIEGSEIRGYYMKVTLENSEPGDAELFAINTNAIKSNV